MKDPYRFVVGGLRREIDRAIEEKEFNGHAAAKITLIFASALESTQMLLVVVADVVGSIAAREQMEERRQVFLLVRAA